MKHCNTFSRIV